MHSIRNKFILTVVSVILITLSIATAIGVISIKNLGRDDADQMLHLTATTGAMNLEQYFESVEHSVRAVSMLVSASFKGMPFEDLGSNVERTRNLFGQIAHNTNGVLTYYFRIDPEISEDVKGFWYVYQAGEGFIEHEVTDITQYDTSDTSALVWFTVPKATGKGTWLSPYYTENLGVRVISYNVPVYWKDRFVGVIGIEIDYEMLKNELENISIFENGYAFILDENANVFYHPLLDSEQLNLETTAVYEPDQFIGSNHVRYNYEGVEKEAFWVPLSNGMRLYVCAPESEINSGWTGMIWIILIALPAILGIGIIVMIRSTDQITKPLRDLIEAAKQVGKGNYDFSLEYDKDDEIGILTRTFKQLATNTKDKITKMEELDRQKIIINDLLMDCIAILRKNEDHDIVLNKLLNLVASFYSADRSYIFEFDLGARRLSNTYEWCAEGIEAEISKLQNLDIAIVDRWIVQFEAHGEFYINSTDGELDHDSDEYKILAMQDIQSLMAAPLRLGGDVVGFLGVDNPRANTNTLLVLQAVSSFVVNQLAKQREERQQLMLSAMTDDYDVLIRSDIDRDTFAVVRGNDSYKVRCPELHTYRSLTAFIDRLTHMNEDEYESFHTRVNIASIKQHMMQEHVLYHNFRLMNKAGDSTTYQLKIVPFGIWPESRWILLGIYNIEETVRAEESQQQMLKEALDKAEHANRAKTSFLSNMSHEIRTPMNAIIGLNNIALNGPNLKPHIREQLEKIGASANHLLGIINDILDMSRIESGRMEIKDEEFSFREFLEQVNVMVGGQCADQKLHYECIIIGKTEEYYMGDKMKLKQVLINILGNAVKFTPAPGSVTLTVEQTNSFEKHRTLSFIISDTGIGMSKEYIPKIFETFSQEKEGAENQYGSTGLGMAITKNIVTMMNGDIKVDSEKGVGTTFTVTVTLKAAEYSIHENHDETLLVGMHALVVDDEPVTREHAQLIAETVGIRTDVAASGKEGLEMIRRANGETYQLILTDFEMPGMDGITFTKKLRDIVGDETMKILLTDYDWEDVREKAIQAGVDAVLYKPLFADTLTQCVRDIMSQRENVAEQKDEEEPPASTGIEGSMVLIAEDMDINAEILIALLEMRQIRSERAKNGQIAVQMFSEHLAGYYDAILMDIRMPVMDGLEATRTIRSMNRPDAKSIPVIAMTANAFEEDVQQSLQAGMNAHLSKPVEPERLYETLNRMIQRN